MPTGINSPQGYSSGNVAGYLPRLELGMKSLIYQQPMTSYPVSFGDYQGNPVLVANEGLYTHGFGMTAHQKRFKLAAKHCKGKSNYRKCMSAQLKKGKKKSTKKTTTSTTRRRKTSGGSKYVSKKRKSPEVSATTKKVGTVAKGLDGKRWVVKKSVNGVKRWARLTKK
jgi:hypothetical protein